MPVYTYEYSGVKHGKKWAWADVKMTHTATTYVHQATTITDGHTVQAVGLPEQQTSLLTLATIPAHILIYYLPYWLYCSFANFTYIYRLIVCMHV